MSKLGTKNVKTEESSISKTFTPGEIVAKINNITLEEAKFKEGAYNLILSLETEPVGPSFEGFFINKDKPELGRYEGKVGSVKATLWPIADGVTKSGIEISRDMELLKLIKQICTATNCVQWFNDQDEKHDTIEQFVNVFRTEAPYANTFYKFCIAGKEYKNKAGYNAYDLFLPKFSKEGNPIEVLNATESKFLKFNREEHIIKRKVENVESFEPATEVFGVPNTDFLSESGTDFDL